MSEQKLAEIKKQIKKQTKYGWKFAVVVLMNNGTWAASTKTDDKAIRIAFEQYGGVDITALVV